MPGSADVHGWRREGSALLRAVAAGTMVGVPLIYTMEMWWRGRTMPEWQLLVLLGATLLANVGFSLLSGFRRESSVVASIYEAFTSVGLALVYASLMLLLIGEIAAEQALSDILGRVIFAAVPVSLGISVANFLLLGKSREGDDDEKEEQPPDDPEWMQLKEDLNDFAATVTGATLFAFAIAPTEEIIMIATRMPPWQHLLMMSASFLLCYTILFAAGFQDEPVYVPGPFQHPVVETTMAYAVSLVIAAALLYLIGVPEATAHPRLFVQCTVVLGLPAVVGASAGRLVT